MKKVLCIGNRYVYPDCAALMVYDEAIKNTNTQVHWIEGGIGGLNLATHFEGVGEMMILDYMPKVENGSFFSLESVLKNTNIQHYSHDNALYYLLNSLDILMDKPPKVTICSCNPDTDDFIPQIVESMQEWTYAS